MLQKYDGVFEGGGVKAIGFVGAVCCLEERNYRWEKLAGTSAGSIIAALMAAGYSGREMKSIMEKTNYTEFTDRKGLGKIPLAGASLDFILNKGVYAGDKIEIWLADLLRRKGKTKFKDVSVKGESKLKIIAADITKGDMLVLPDDLKSYGLDPMEFEISKAVRMSTSIPFFFKPYKLRFKNKMNYIVDGGVLSNYPLWIFDIDGVPKWPTLGFKFVENNVSRTSLGKKDLVSYSFDILNTMINKNEVRYLKHKELVRTIMVPTCGVGTTDFNLSRDKSLELYNSGYEAAREFLGKWNFRQYVSRFRSSKTEI